MFLYFDLGNVLLYFDHETACRQMAAVATTEAHRVLPGDVRRIVFESELENLYETGQVTSREFYEAFCEAVGTRPDFDHLLHAACDIFWPNVSIKPVIGALRHANQPLGLLSNTNEAHWQYVSRGRYGLIPSAFDVLALSYELKAMKPDPMIFFRAAELAGVPPREIFYVDDRADNLAAAREVGYHTVLYSTTSELVVELRELGIGFNY
jgi:putative hydrolase of the HAD superfamily